MNAETILMMVVNAMIMLCAVVFYCMGVRGDKGTLPPNGLVGVRIAATFAHDDAWYAAHKKIGPSLKAFSVAIFLAALTALIVSVLTGNRFPSVFFTLIAAALMLACTVVIWIQAEREAKKHTEL